MSWSLLVSCEVLFVKRLCFHYFLLFSSFPLHLFVFSFFFLVPLFHPFPFFEGVRGEVGGRLIIHQEVPYRIHFGHLSLHY